ncbi:MAG: hypothetical protein M3077_13140 [Candidatus Dormibacteraeota bacterium]|nr:hypothetical protein [Candidatus Dormibacteraeota bacterium]
MDFERLQEVGCLGGGYVIRPALVAGESIFYLSSDGFVTQLRASGPAKAVTRLPRQANDQAIWFAVKPDGTRLMATVVTYPPRTPGQELPPACSGPSRIQMLSAVFPAEAAVIRELSPSDRNLAAVIGWDNAGPLATIDTRMAHIGTPEGSEWFGRAASPRY